MKTAICYYSRHHGNTRQVLEAMAREGDVELIDVTTRQTVRLERYDCIGFASGIYAFAFHPAVAEFARQYLPQGKPVFFVDTYGGSGAPARKLWRRSPGRRGARCWGSSTARGTTPLALSGWWAGSPRAAQTYGIWKTPGRFFREVQAGFPETDRDEVC